VLFNQKFVTKISKIWFGIRDLEKNLFQIPDPEHNLIFSKKNLQDQLYRIELCMAWHLPKSILYKSQDGCGSEVREDEKTAVEVRP
jgi:hypothetical protein